VQVLAESSSGYGVVVTQEFSKLLSSVQIRVPASPAQRAQYSEPQKAMSTTTDQIAEAFTAYIEENIKFVEKGNKSAGTRARKALLDLTKLAKVRRAEISEAKAED
jgi:hypothetical protein